jgi:hypothetical protein
MKTFAKQVKAIVSMFANLNGASFVGIREYLSTTSGELANYVVIANFSYANAVEHDLKALQSATAIDMQIIASKFNFSVSLVQQAIEKLSLAFIANQNSETQSNQSKGQDNAYLTITNGVKLHIETGTIKIYGLIHDKVTITDGEPKKPVNSKELTLCQNAVKKYFGFKTTKVREFTVKPEQLSMVKIQGETVSLA